MNIRFASDLFPHSVLGLTVVFCFVILSVLYFLSLLLCHSFQMSPVFLLRCSLILLYFRVFDDPFLFPHLRLSLITSTSSAEAFYLHSVYPSFAFCNFLSFVVSLCVTTLLFSFHVKSPSVLATIPFHF
jgi:hypothetical protein